MDIWRPRRGAEQSPLFLDIYWPTISPQKFAEPQTVACQILKIFLSGLRPRLFSSPPVCASITLLLRMLVTSYGSSRPPPPPSLQWEIWFSINGTAATMVLDMCYPSSGVRDRHPADFIVVSTLQTIISRSNTGPALNHGYLRRNTGGTLLWDNTSLTHTGG